MKNKLLKINSKNSGFTLIETLVAIFILFIALNSLFSLTSNNYFTSRYAKNESTGVYLAQEAMDYIRNDRDTTAFQLHDWSSFLAHYGDPVSNTLCYSQDGCILDANNWADPVKLGDPLPAISACGSVCDAFRLNDTSNFGPYYTYDVRSTGQTNTNIRRRINITLGNGTDEMQIKVTVEWLNGEITRSVTSRTSLLEWQL